MQVGSVFKFYLFFSFFLCALHSICKDLFTHITPRKLLGFHHRHSFLWSPNPSHAPFLTHTLYMWLLLLWMVIVLAWQGGFQSLKSNKRWGRIRRFPFQASISNSNLYVISFPHLEIKASKQFWWKFTYKVYIIDGATLSTING